MFPRRLSCLRKGMKISQYGLAERLGMTRGQLANYEQGKRQPDQETLVKLADFFDVSIDYLLGRTDTPNRVGINSEHDIAKRLEQIQKELEYSNDLSFNGKPLVKEAKESIFDSIDLILKNTYRINKQ